MTDTKVFNNGDRVKYKLGLEGIIHGVIKELRNEQGAMVQELKDEEAIYLFGYLDKNGDVKIVKVNECVLEPYVG